MRFFTRRTLRGEGRTESSNTVTPVRASRIHFLCAARARSNDTKWPGGDGSGPSSQSISPRRTTAPVATQMKVTTAPSA